MVIGAGDLDSEPRLKLAQGEDGAALGIVVTAHLHVREEVARAAVTAPIIVPIRRSM